MLILCSILCFLIFSSMTMNSVSSFKLESLRGAAGLKMTTVNPVHINIDRNDEDSTLWNDGNRSYSLQRRELISSSIAIGALVFSNLNNMETAVNAIANILARLSGVKRNGSLENGGKLSPERSSTSWTGTILEFDSGPVHVFVISPTMPQRVVIRHRRVFLNNNNLVCQDTKRLEGKEAYEQIGPGKSLWYTNLDVGEKMTKEEIAEFKKIQEQIEEEKQKAVRGVVAQAEEKLRTAGKLTRTMTFKADQGRKTVIDFGRAFAERYMGYDTPSDSEDETDKARLEKYLSDPYSESDTESLRSCLERCWRIWAGGPSGLTLGRLTSWVGRARSNISNKSRASFQSSRSRAVSPISTATSRKSRSRL